MNIFHRYVKLPEGIILVLSVVCVPWSYPQPLCPNIWDFDQNLFFQNISWHTYWNSRYSRGDHFRCCCFALDLVDVAILVMLRREKLEKRHPHIGAWSIHSNGDAIGYSWDYETWDILESPTIKSKNGLPF